MSKIATYEDRIIKNYSDQKKLLNFVYISSTTDQTPLQTFNVSGGTFDIQKVNNVLMDSAKLDLVSSDFSLDSYLTSNIRLENTYSMRTLLFSINDEFFYLYVHTLFTNFSVANNILKFDFRCIITDNRLIDYTNQSDEQILAILSINTTSQYLNLDIKNIQIDLISSSIIPNVSQEFTFSRTDIPTLKTIPGTSNNTVSFSANFKLNNSTFDVSDVHNRIAFEYKYNQDEIVKTDLELKGNITASIIPALGKPNVGITVNVLDEAYIKSGNLGFSSNVESGTISGTLNNTTDNPIKFFDPNDNIELLLSNPLQSYELQNLKYNTSIPLLIQDNTNICSNCVGTMRGFFTVARMVGRKIFIGSSNSNNFSFVYNAASLDGRYSFVNSGLLTGNNLRIRFIKKKYFTLENLFQGADYVESSYTKESITLHLFSNTSLSGKNIISLMYNPMFQMFRLIIVSDTGSDSDVGSFFPLIPVPNTNITGKEMDYQRLYNTYKKNQGSSDEEYVNYFQERYGFSISVRNSILNDLKAKRYSLAFSKIANYRSNVGFMAVQYKDSNGKGSYKVFKHRDWNLENVYSFMNINSPIVSGNKITCIYDFSINPLEHIARVQLDYCDRLAVVTDTMYPTTFLFVPGVKNDEFCIDSIGNLTFNYIKDGMRYDQADSIVRLKIPKYDRYYEMFTNLYSKNGYVRMEPENNFADVVNFNDTEDVFRRKYHIGKGLFKEVTIGLFNYIKGVYVNCIPLSISVPLIIKKQDRKNIDWNTATYTILNENKRYDGVYMCVRETVMQSGTNIFVNKSLFNYGERTADKIYESGISDKTNLGQSYLVQENKVVLKKGGSIETVRHIFNMAVPGSREFKNSVILKIPNVIWNNLVNNNIEVISRGAFTQLSKNDYYFNLGVKTKEYIEKIIESINFDNMKQSQTISTSKLILDQTTFVVSVLGKALISIADIVVPIVFDKYLGPTFLNNYGNTNSSQNMVTYDSVKIFDGDTEKIITFYFFVQ